MTRQHSGLNAVQFANVSIARKLRDRRSEAGLSQGAVAKKAKIRQETLSRIEHGHGNPTVGVIERIVSAIERLDKRIAPPEPFRDEKSRKKVLQVEIHNSDLNALEDLVYCALTPGARRLAEDKAKRLWNALVAAWDEPWKTSQQPAGKRPRAPAGSLGARKFIPAERARKELGL